MISILRGFRARRAGNKTGSSLAGLRALGPALQPVAEALEDRLFRTASVWNNLSSSAPSWNNSANWNPSTSYPSNLSDSANLNVAITTNQAISLGTNITLNSLTLGDSALSGGVSNTETINAGNTLTFDNGSSAASLTLASGAVAGATIAAPISLNSSLTITNNSSQTLTISGNIAMNGHSITVVGSGAVVFSGAVASSGPATLLNEGSGTLTLSGSSDNSYLLLDAEGGTTILDKNSNVSVHAVAGISNIASGAAVELSGSGGDQIFNGLPGFPGGVVMGGGTLELAGNTEAFDTLIGSGTVTNSSTAASALLLGSDNRSGTFSGTIQGGSGALTLVKIGSGTLTLSGTGDNSYLVLDAEAGTTILAKTNSTSAHAVAAISNIASGATVQLAGTGGDQIFNGAPSYPGGVVMGGGTLDLAGTSEAFDTLTGSGTVTDSSTAASALILGSDNGSGTFSGTIQNGSGTVALTKSGSGTLTLFGTSTYGGTTSLSGGTLDVTGSIGGSPLSFAGGTIVPFGSAETTVGGVVWSDTDIGSPALAGGASYSGTNWTVLGGGSDIYGTSDQFNFVSENYTGDGSIAADVTGQTDTDPWAKAGVMLRNDSTAGAAYAAVVVTPGEGITFQWRSSAGGSTGYARVGGVTPEWVQLIRSGSSFTPYFSTDGQKWVQFAAPQTVSMGTTALAGLAVTSHSSSLASAATFSNVTIGTTIAAPGDVNVTPLSETSNLITWSAPPTATSYTVYRSVDGGAPTAIGTTSSTSFTDTSSAAGQVSAYTVAASNSTGTSAASAAVSATSPATGTDQLWSVTLGAGQMGSTAATDTDTLTVATAEVWASSPELAVIEAVTGSTTADLTAVLPGSAVQTYNFPGSVLLPNESYSPSAAYAYVIRNDQTPDRQAFNPATENGLNQPTPGTYTGWIGLEDGANLPPSDNDFNDRYWALTVVNVTP